MWMWIATNGGTILIAALLIGIVVAGIVSLVRDRKKGGSSCGCGCAHCAMADACHSRGKNE